MSDFKELKVKHAFRLIAFSDCVFRPASNSGPNCFISPPLYTAHTDALYWHPRTDMCRRYRLYSECTGFREERTRRRTELQKGHKEMPRPKMDSSGHVEIPPAQKEVKLIYILLSSPPSERPIIICCNDNTGFSCSSHKYLLFKF